ncbi:hypothetical protein K503DRAFT_772177 [Rhizopogon vinicolor AM-OR11-026]|uniref:Family A G protein-coupled receptor-like protein n=1 Tax=Rhizopogon vinicolor AM-OR11-026 TaxID=1314800 RepID=A0A1B7MW18_9AGAM|nr:hypothetical protein K503DRAFT_772177 [Rhizopogon vinicolor AM-OR11-026]
MGISVTEATILAVVLECILYGISTFLFGITLWALTYQRKAAEVARPMLAAACLLFLMCTMHIIFAGKNIWHGFISSADAEIFFEDISNGQGMVILNTLETLFGDAILIYRCYVIWQRTRVIIIPIIGWVSIAVTGGYTTWALCQLTPANADVVFLQYKKWVVLFLTTAFVTNLLTTSILALKLWLVHRRSLGIRVTRSQVYPIMRIIVESGALYSVSLVTMLATYLSASNSAYVVTDMICQIIPITFFLIIVRTAMLRFSDRTGQGLFTHTLTSNHLSAPNAMTVHIDRLTVADDIGASPKVYPAPIEDAYHLKMHSYHDAEQRIVIQQ